MTMQTQYSGIEPARIEIDAIVEPLVVEFGASWCPICRDAQPMISTAFAAHADVRHIKVEDGSGRPLGRSFRVKLWPTLIFMRDGKELTRVVRPTTSAQLDRGFELITVASRAT
jgi:thioredoxin 1